MLVLSIRPGVRLQFTLPDGQTIKVVVHRLTKSKVQLGMRMPDAVRVHRVEDMESVKTISSR